MAITKSSDWAPPKGSWEDKVQAVDTIEADNGVYMSSALERWHKVKASDREMLREVSANCMWTHRLVVAENEMANPVIDVTLLRRTPVLFAFILFY
jgi:hypothetical protein